MEDELKLVEELMEGKEIEGGKKSFISEVLLGKEQRSGILTEEESVVRQQFVVLLVGWFVKQ